MLDVRVRRVEHRQDPVLARAGRRRDAPRDLLLQHDVQVAHVAAQREEAAQQRAARCSTAGCRRGGCRRGRARARSTRERVAAHDLRRSRARARARASASARVELDRDHASRARAASGSVSAPAPGPISRNTSSGRGAITRSSRSTDAGRRKCWPSRRGMRQRSIGIAQAAAVSLSARLPELRPRSDRLHVAFVTSEMAPYVKTGGLADVSAALPKALARLGHRVTVVLPRYRQDRVPAGRVRGLGARAGRRVHAQRRLLPRRATPTASRSCSSSTRRSSTAPDGALRRLRATTACASPSSRAPRSSTSGAAASGPTSSTPTTGRPASCPCT